MRKYTKSFAVAVLAAAIAGCGGGGGSAGSTAAGSTGTTGTTGSTGTTTTDTTSTTTVGTVTAASAVSVSIGTDGTIGAEAVSSLKYAKRFVVTVVDQQGRPVLGATVDPRVEMVSFDKGYIVRDTTSFEVTGTNRVTCAAEDRNNNDILDAGEDINGDGVLTPPRSVVTIVPTDGRYTTDATGSVIFELQYPKDYATWIVPALVVKASVTGSEGTARREYFAGYAAGDEKAPGAPFIVSPFSPSVIPTANPSCTDNL